MSLKLGRVRHTCPTPRARKRDTDAGAPEFHQALLKQIAEATNVPSIITSIKATVVVRAAHTCPRRCARADKAVIGVERRGAAVLHRKNRATLPASAEHHGAPLRQPFANRLQLFIEIDIKPSVLVWCG
ncbi:hypothetical protein EVAR_65860_1 [Eumeta japonica]|uniref:Uncharacterized protein n=1 Tax=Eumeta variegata TaxID=151549 RepID=A0A4C1ZMF4_EUMVA|nr:hypothetical protein EVAR_65860_1 [Eumeta japonica]